MPDDVLSSPPRRPLGPVGKALAVLAGGAVVVTLGVTALRAGDDSGSVPPSSSPSPTASPAGPATPVAGPARTLRGAPPAGRTGLRVLVAADPPVAIDIDDGTRHPVRGLPKDGRRLHSVVAFGANAAIIESHKVCDDCEADADLFVVGRDLEARRIGTGIGPVPSRDGRSVWVTHTGENGRCRLDRLTVYGGEPSKRGIARLDCRIRVVRDAEPGLVLDGPADGPDDAMLLDSDGTSRAELRGPTAYAGGAWVQFDTFGRRVLLRGGMIEWTWPSALRYPPSELVPDYGDWYLFAEFTEPSETPIAGAGPSQLIDLWVLDSVRPRWIRTPRMPLAVELKRTSAAWTPDNRLVMVGTFPGVGEAAAIWERGRRDWAVRPVDLPDDRSSDTFALLPP